MYHIIFMSRAASNFTRAEIKEMCETSAARNEISKITGLFLYDGSRFLQVVKGEEIAVKELMIRIARDPRHFDVMTVSSKAINRREFHDYAMSQPLYGVGDDPQVYMLAIMHDLRDVLDNELKALFVGFAALAKGARFRYQ